MASMNKVFLVGNLGQDPELRTTRSGRSVCNFTLATHTGGKDNDKTEWHKIVCWGPTADAVSQYLVKGSQALVEGRIQSSSYETKEGDKRWKTEIIAQRVEFLARQSSAA